MKNKSDHNKKGRTGSPEQLDKLLKITTPAAWIALISVGIFIVAVVFWGVWGSIPEKVQGQGILMRRGGLYSIDAQTTGILERIYCKSNDIIEQGQIVAYIKQQSVIDQIKVTENQINDYQAKYNETKEFRKDYYELEKRSTKKQQLNLTLNNNSLKSRLKSLKEKLVKQKKLVKLGLITTDELLTTQENIDTASDQIRSNNNNIKQLNLKLVELSQKNNLDLLEIQSQISNQKTVLDNLVNNINSYSPIISPYTGRIVSVYKRINQSVDAGTEIMTVELTGNKDNFLEAVMYYPAGLGKKIKTGMIANVDPINVEKDKYGSIIGLVSYASSFPTSSQDMQNVLQNESLVSQLTAKGDPLEIRIALLPTSDTFSKYKWTSSKGPNIHIQAGSSCYGSVIVERWSPFRLLIPAIKGYLFNEYKPTTGGLSNAGD